jgi:hemerythrin-like domain-containing protein
MEAGLSKMREAAARSDYPAVSAALKELDSIFRQHIADEEAQLLRLLIDNLGVKGAEQEIRVFQQHRPIHRLMELISELAAKSAEELGEEQRKLDELFQQHTALEERGVFPKALGIYRQGRQPMQPD